MKKAIMLGILILMACVFGSATHAALVKSYTDDPTTDIYMGSNQNTITYQKLFNNFLNDFQNGSITAATLKVILYDDSDTTDDKFTFKGDSTVLVQKGAGFKMNNTPFTFSGDVLSDIQDGSLIAFIQRDGGSSDFYLDKFILEITGESPTVVPIPAAAWLLGTGLIGLVVIRRRKQ